MNDYISREAMHRANKIEWDGIILKGYNDGHQVFIDNEEMIDSVPAADVKPVVRGKWISYPVLDDMCYQHYSCSICKRVEAIPHGYDVKKELPFCHCGADMREVKQCDKE